VSENNRYREVVQELLDAIDLLVDHHCGGLCGCGVYDDPPHPEVMEKAYQAQLSGEALLKGDVDGRNGEVQGSVGQGHDRSR
jgi:hypothetical protein